MRVVGWERFQGYTKRGPAWIKLHLSLVDQPQYLELPLVARAVLPALWLTAARLGETGELPGDPVILARLSHLAEDELRQALPALVRAGFLERDESVADLATNPSQEPRESATNPSRPPRQVPAVRSLQTERETETEAENGLRPPAAVEAPAKSWTAEACDDWQARFGGTAPGGRIGKALKPLVGLHGWEAVRAAWRAYLGQIDAEFASAERFASTFGRWSGSSPPPPSKATGLVGRNRAVLERFVAEDGGKT